MEYCYFIFKKCSGKPWVRTQIDHDERYDIAAEYLEVVYKLWEGSWEDDAVVLDKERKIYVDPNKVHDIEHSGKYFKVPGAHLCNHLFKELLLFFKQVLQKREGNLQQRMLN